MALVSFLSVFFFVSLQWSVGTSSKQLPNIVFLMGESVASSGYFFGKKAPMPIPNLEFLMKNGVSFPQTYAAAPVCNPSRATTLTGRHAHYLGHYQMNPPTKLWVTGSWNNHEGISADYNATFLNITKKYAGYNWKFFGKEDYTAGQHSLSCRVTSWCNKVNFPYTLNESLYNDGYGWYDEDGAVYNDLNTTNPNATKHQNDWNNVNAAAKWIIKQSNESPNIPWLMYWGSYIVHPPYGTTQYWLNQVNDSMMDAPYWIPKNELHPEDFQSSMKKKFFGPCCSNDYKKQIRKHYYALIAEYDAMIGVIINAVKEANVLNNTWIIATSDHGDMKMEHQQFYKMVFYDSSSRVPNIIYAGNNFNIKRNVIRNDLIISMLDFFPTILDIAHININNISEDLQLNGYSLMPYLLNNNNNNDMYYMYNRPNYVMSQFHGDEIHLSWFLLRDADMKYVTYGSGKEVPVRLFNITADPLELNDLAMNSSYKELINSMDQKLRTIIDYPSVAADVESYNKQSFVLWRNSFSSQADFNKTISQDIRWSKSWAYNSDLCFQAIDDWLKTPNDTFFWAFQ